MRVSSQCGFNLVVLGVTLLALTGCERQRTSREHQLLLEALKEQCATVAQIEEHRQLLATEKEEIQSQRGQLDNEQKRLGEERKAIESERRKNEAALASLAATEKRNQELLGKIATDQSRLDSAFAEMDRIRKVNELRAPFAGGLAKLFEDTWRVDPGKISDAISQSGAWTAKTDDEFRAMAVDACMRYCIIDKAGGGWLLYRTDFTVPDPDPHPMFTMRAYPRLVVPKIREFLLKPEHVDLIKMGLLEISDDRYQAPRSK